MPLSGAGFSEAKDTVEISLINRKSIVITILFILHSMFSGRLFQNQIFSRKVEDVFQFISLCRPYNLKTNNLSIFINIKIYAFLYFFGMRNFFFLNSDVKCINLFIVFNLHCPSYLFLSITVITIILSTSCLKVTLSHLLPICLKAFFLPFVESSISSW